MDKRGVHRGKCKITSCSCAQYQAKKTSHRCSVCGHPPIEHVLKSSSAHARNTRSSTLNLVPGPSSRRSPSKHEDRRRSVEIDADTSENPECASPDESPEDFICHLEGCLNRRHVEDNGVVHDCCCFSHAMELQRRKLVISSAKIKGVTHCLLPDCEKIVWPFMNYCSKTHAQVGVQLGLIPEPGPSGGNSEEKSGDTCYLPGCSEPRCVENGVVYPFCTRYHADIAKMKNITVPIPPEEKCIIPECDKRRYPEHPFCGKTHAEEGKTREIYVTTENAEEQCELEGCTRARKEENGQKHNYCCKEHAENDVNASIKTKEVIQEWLKTFTNLTIVKLDENPSAKFGGELLKKFHAAWKGLPWDQRKTVLAFHGTASTNIDSICSQGFDPLKRGQHGQASGPGEYFATDPQKPMGFSSQGKKMLVCELLLGKEGVHHTKYGNVIVVKQSAHELPRFVLQFA